MQDDFRDRKTFWDRFWPVAVFLLITSCVFCALLSYGAEAVYTYHPAEHSKMTSPAYEIAAFLFLIPAAWIIFLKQTIHSMPDNIQNEWLARLLAVVLAGSITFGLAALELVLIIGTLSLRRP